MKTIHQIIKYCARAVRRPHASVQLTDGAGTIFNYRFNKFALTLAAVVSLIALYCTQVEFDNPIDPKNNPVVTPPECDDKTQYCSADDAAIGQWCVIGNNCTQIKLKDTRCAGTVSPVNTCSADPDPWDGKWCLIANACAAANQSNYNAADCPYTSQGDCEEGIVIKPSQYKIEFRANIPGGIVTPEITYTGTDGKLKSLPTPTADGYKFVEWYILPGEEKVVENSTVFTADTTVYARWTQIYTITYTLPNGGVNNPSNPQTYTALDGAIPLLAPSVPHYDFGGWFANAAFSGGAVTSIPAGSTGNKTYYAKCTPIKYKVTVIDRFFDTEYSITEYDITNPTITLPPVDDADSCYFNGWYADSNYTNKVSREFTIDTLVDPLGDKTYYTQWAGKPVQGTRQDPYPTVIIGKQIWTAENLNDNPFGSCYDNDDKLCETYGRMYTQPEAVTVCDALGNGWHLPSDAEWDVLMRHINPAHISGECDTAGSKLRSTTGWDSNGNGTDEYGFSALPGGYRNAQGFDGAGRYAYWWSATESEDDANKAYTRFIQLNSDYVFRGNNNKVPTALSVRCVRDPD